MPNSTVCHVCGFSENNMQANPLHAHAQPVAQTIPVQDSGGFAWGFFGFIFCTLVFPLIFFFQWKNTTPLRARATLIGYLIGLIVFIILCVIAGLVFIAYEQAIIDWLENQSANIFRLVS